MPKSYSKALLYGCFLFLSSQVALATEAQVYRFIEKSCVVPGLVV